MASARTARRSGTQTAFLRQALLIVLPLLALVAVGVVALRRDKALVRVEAALRAQMISLECLQWITNDLPREALASSAVELECTQAGELLNPRPVVPLAPHLLRESDLEPEQQGLWDTANRVQLRGEGTPAAWEAFLNGNPPAEWASLARFRRGLALEKAERFREAAEQFEALFQSGSNGSPVYGETGLPLAPLSAIRRVSLDTQMGSAASPGYVRAVEVLDDHRRLEPNPFTGFLLAEAASAETQQGRTNLVQAVLERWKSDEQVRVVFAALRSAWGTNVSLRPQWSRFELPAGSAGTQGWFAMPQPRETNKVICVSATRTENFCRDFLNGLQGVPAYLRISFELAGHPLLPARRDPRSNPPDVLGAAGLLDSGRRGVYVEVTLDEPGLLFAQQRTRAAWFALLIGTCALAATMGLVANWRSLRKQQELVAMKDNFVSSVTHELRAPIAAIRLMAENLDRGKIEEPKRQGDYFRFMVQECRRLSALIGNVLDFARIEQGRKEYVFEPTDLDALAAQTIRLMEPAAAERQINLALERNPASGPLPAPLLDGGAMQQACVNLLDNALKHSPKGSRVTLGIAVLPVELHFSVTDQGEGIPATEHERVFERFYRRGSELRRETQGVGIGLSIVKHIAEAHGGRVLLKSEPGRGSCFTIIIPLKLA